MKGMKCACGKIAKYVKDLKLNDVYKIEGWECEFCGAVYYDPEKAKKTFSLDKLIK